MDTTKKLWMAGHHVRNGQAVVCLTHGDGGPVRFYGEMRASKVRMIIERFNRMQIFKAGSGDPSKALF